MSISEVTARLLAVGAVAAWIAGVRRFAVRRSSRRRRTEGSADWPPQLYVKGTGFLLLAVLLGICLALTEP